MVVCSGLHTQRLHLQLGVLRDVWLVPSEYWGLAGASPAPWPCPASVSMWTPGCTGAKAGRLPTRGLGGGPSSGPNPAQETGFSPHPPCLEGALFMEVRPSTSRASRATWPPSQPFSWATGLPAACS